jgi:cytidylate kinase
MEQIVQQAVAMMAGSKQCAGGNCARPISANKTFCLACLAKLARVNLKLEHDIDVNQQSMVNMLRDEAGVW